MMKVNMLWCQKLIKISDGNVRHNGLDKVVTTLNDIFKNHVEWAANEQVCTSRKLNIY